MKKLIGVLGVVMLVGAACAGSTEDQFREDLTSTGASDEQVDCMISGFNDAGISLDSISDENFDNADGPTQQQAGEILAGCMLGIGFDDAGSGLLDGLDDIELDPVTSDANDYGDDPVLDAYYDGCTNGDGQACDDLYFQSPFGSAYETYGDTCGGRFGESPGLCSTALE